MNVDPTGCASSVSTSPTPSIDCAAHRALEEIGHAVGAFDERSALPTYVAVAAVRHIVRESWGGDWPEWAPNHDTTEHGDCSPWCAACRKSRLPPCSNA